YQAQSPIRENIATLSSQYHGAKGSSEDIHEIPLHLLDGTVLTDEQVFAMMHAPPAAVHREDLYRASPTLTASQTLAATYSHVRPESPYQPYSSYSPYSGNHPLPSPSILESGSIGYRSHVGAAAPATASGYSSPALISSPYMAPEETRSEARAADPYRSAYSHNHHQSEKKQPSSTSPYLGSQYTTLSLGSSPMMNQDFSSSFDSRYSSASHNNSINNTTATTTTTTTTNNNNNNNNQSNSIGRYPTHALSGQDSSQALSASFYEGQHQHHHTKSASNERGGQTSGNGKSSLITTDGGDKEEYALVDMSASGISAGDPSSIDTRTTTSLAHPTPSRPSKIGSLRTQKKTQQTVEDAENDVILQKLGVISGDSATRSGLTNSSGRSRRKGHWTDDSEEEGRARAMGHRRRQRRRSSSQRRKGLEGQKEKDPRICCCSRKSCLCLTFSLFVCLAITLFFIIPRTPVFTFESLTSDGDPVLTKDRIRELFSIQILVDSRQNYLPIRVDSFDVSILLKMSADKIANNEDLPSSFIIQPGMSQVLSVPMRLDYKAKKHADGEEDGTFETLLRACTLPREGSMTLRVAPPKLDLMVYGQLHVWGLAWVWKPEFRFSVDNVLCPAHATPTESLPAPQDISQDTR
ncbi:hypothetical protein BGZ94_010042, partial [Podila epigama]